MVEVYICSLPKMRNKREIDALIPFISEEKQKRVKRFKFIDDQYRSVIGELLVRYICRFRYSMLEKDFQLTKNRYGKPYLPLYPNFYFNIAHSGEWVVCAIHNNEVGIDIECIKPIEESIMLSILREKEVEYLSSKPNKLAAFYEIWTVKESYLKAIGSGLAISLQSFYADISNLENIKLVDCEKNTYIENINCIVYKIDENHLISTCIRNQGQSVESIEYYYLSFNQVISNVCRLLVK